MALLYLSLVADFVGFCSKLLSLTFHLKNVSNELMSSEKHVKRGLMLVSADPVGRAVLKGSLRFTRSRLYTLYWNSDCEKSGKAANVKVIFTLIFYLNVIFTFVSCVSCSCFSVSKKKRKKIYYTLQSFKCSQIISNQNRMDGEVCCILVWFCLSSFKYNSQLFWAQVIYQKKESMI